MRRRPPPAAYAASEKVRCSPAGQAPSSTRSAPPGRNSNSPIPGSNTAPEPRRNSISFTGARRPERAGVAREGYDYVAYEDTSAQPRRSAVVVRKGDRKVAEIPCTGAKDDGMPKEAGQMPSNLVVQVPFDDDLLK